MNSIVLLCSQQLFLFFYLEACNAAPRAWTAWSSVASEQYNVQAIAELRRSP